MQADWRNWHFCLAKYVPIGSSHSIQMAMPCASSRAFTCTKNSVITMKRTTGVKRKRDLGWEIYPEIRAEVAQLTETCLPLSVGSALGNWLLLGVVLVVISHLRGWWMVIWVVLWVVACRALRAFENLTHEASHYNWSRKHRRLND